MGINLVFVAVGILVIAIIFHKKTFITVPCYLFLMLFIMFLFIPVEYLQKVPMVSIEQGSTLNIDTNATFKLVSGESYLIPTEFIIDGSTSASSLSKYLDEQSKAIVIEIVKEDQALYSKSIGSITSYDSTEYANKILGMYNTWKSSGTMPNEDTTIRIGKFYLVR